MFILQKTISARDFQRQYNKIIGSVESSNSPVVIISHNKPKAFIGSLKLLQKFEKYLLLDSLSDLRQSVSRKDEQDVLQDIEKEVKTVRRQLYADEKKTSRGN